MGGFLFVCPKRNQKCPGGLSPVNASQKAGVHSRLTPRPPFTGAGHFGLLVHSGGLSFDRAFLFTRPTGAFCHQNLNQVVLPNTAYCLPTCWVRRWSGDQLPQFCQDRRCYFNAECRKLQPGQAPVGRGKKDQTVLSLPAGFIFQSFWRASPVKKGLGGKPPMSARCAKALIEGGPQRIFGYFLCEQKVTPVPPPRRAEPSQ